MSRVVAEVQPTLEQSVLARGMLERPIGALRIQAPGPGPVLPAVPFDELCPSTRVILQRHRSSETHPLAVVPSPRARLNDLERLASNSASGSVKPLLLADHYSTREPRAELGMGAPRDIHTTPAGTSGAVLTLKIGACFVAQYHVRSKN